MIHGVYVFSEEEDEDDDDDGNLQSMDMAMLQEHARCSLCREILSSEGRYDNDSQSVCVLSEREMKQSKSRYDNE